jgi:hypothetical protein
MTRISTMILAVALALAIAPAQAATTGAPAPQFTGTDSNGVAHKLSDYAGKIVILEWNNDQCHYVGKLYGTGNMQKLQADVTAVGAVWLSVISSAPGTQGYVTGLEANAIVKQRGAHPTAVLLDPAGKIGMAYGAKTTPHMYIINASQKLVYQGAIDDQPTSNWNTVPGAKNYVRQALAEMKAGKPISVPQTTPYGCSVKYGS